MDDIGFIKNFISPIKAYECIIPSGIGEIMIQGEYSPSMDAMYVKYTTSLTDLGGSELEKILERPSDNERFVSEILKKMSFEEPENQNDYINDLIIRYKDSVKFNNRDNIVLNHEFCHVYITKNSTYWALLQSCNYASIHIFLALKNLELDDKSFEKLYNHFIFIEGIHSRLIEDWRCLQELITHGLIYSRFKDETNFSKKEKIDKILMKFIELYGIEKGTQILNEIIFISSEIHPGIAIENIIQKEDTEESKKLISPRYRFSKFFSFMKQNEEKFQFLLNSIKGKEELSELLKDDEPDTLKFLLVLFAYLKIPLFDNNDIFGKKLIMKFMKPLDKKIQDKMKDSYNSINKYINIKYFFEMKKFYHPTFMFDNIDNSIHFYPNIVIKNKYPYVTAFLFYNMIRDRFYENIQKKELNLNKFYDSCPGIFLQRCNRNCALCKFNFLFSSTIELYKRCEKKGLL